MRKLKCLLVISKWHSSIHWQLSVKAMNLAVNFFLQFSSVGCHLPRSQQLIFYFQNSLTRIFFFRSSLVSAYKSLFLQFRAQKGASLVFSECDKSTGLMYIFSWLSKPCQLIRDAYVLSIQHQRITSLGRCFYANSYTDVSTDITFYEVSGTKFGRLKKKISDQSYS